MKGVKISATSNILETNRCWHNLKKNYNLFFNKFGDISSDLMSNIDIRLVIVLFLEDLVFSVDVGFDELKTKFVPLLQLISQKANLNKEPVIICYGRTQSFNAIESVKSENVIQQFDRWLVGQFTSLKESHESLYFINLSELFYEIGISNAYSIRNWYFGKCRLSSTGINLLTDSLANVIFRFDNPASKVLVLDCDNTLWGGVIGEDGIKGLVIGQDGLGQAFVDFQKEVLRLINKGVIVALASKNNENDVWYVFENHREMVLKRDHVIVAKIDWNEKPQNLKKMAKELALNPDSFVFWDDNPLERDKMKAMIPEVFTVDVPKNVFEWPGLLRNLTNFLKFKITDEDKEKVNHYKIRANFNLNGLDVTDPAAYLKSLQLHPLALPLSDDNLNRAEQMCMKTNQFNLRVQRHSAQKLLSMHKQNSNFVFLVRLSDVYGDHGIISLVCMLPLTKNCIFIDTFLMSCRILGRHLEAWILREMVCRAKSHNKKIIIAEYIDTGRNQLAKQFLNTYSFKLLSKVSSDEVDWKPAEYDKDNCYYYLNITDINIPNIEIYNRE